MSNLAKVTVLHAMAVFIRFFREKVLTNEAMGAIIALQKKQSLRSHPATVGAPG